MPDITLCCPACGSSDLATIEDLLGSAGCEVFRDGKTGEGVHNYDGWTEVSWDSSESKGFECRSCHWTQEGREGPDYDQLVPQEGVS